VARIDAKHGPHSSLSQVLRKISQGKANMKKVIIQRVDGVTRVKLPEGVTAHDFIDWLNDDPHKKDLEFDEEFERWETADIPEEWIS